MARGGNAYRHLQEEAAIGGQPRSSRRSVPTTFCCLLSLKAGVAFIGALSVVAGLLYLTSAMEMFRDDSLFLDIEQTYEYQMSPGGFAFRGSLAIVTGIMGIIGAILGDWRSVRVFFWYNIACLVCYVVMLVAQPFLVGHYWQQSHDTTTPTAGCTEYTEVYYPTFRECTTTADGFYVVAGARLLTGAYFLIIIGTLMEKLRNARAQAAPRAPGSQADADLDMAIQMSIVESQQDSQGYVPPRVPDVAASTHDDKPLSSAESPRVPHSTPVDFVPPPPPPPIR